MMARIIRAVSKKCQDESRKLLVRPRQQDNR